MARLADWLTTKRCQLGCSSSSIFRALRKTLDGAQARTHLARFLGQSPICPGKSNGKSRLNGLRRSSRFSGASGCDGASFSRWSRFLRLRRRPEGMLQ
jgi:hypothetical protein